VLGRRFLFAHIADERKKGFPDSWQAERKASSHAVGRRRDEGEFVPSNGLPFCRDIPLFVGLALGAGYPRPNPRNGIIARGERLVELGCVEIVHRLSEGRTDRDTELHQVVAIQ
jgi:hypothetical protein